MKTNNVSDKFAARFGIGCLLTLGAIVVALCIMLIILITKL